MIEPLLLKVNPSRNGNNGTAKRPGDYGQIPQEIIYPQKRYFGRRIALVAAGLVIAEIGALAWNIYYDLKQMEQILKKPTPHYVVDLNGDQIPDLLLRDKKGKVTALLGHSDGTFAELELLTPKQQTTIDKIIQR